MRPLSFAANEMAMLARATMSIVIAIERNRLMDCDIVPPEVFETIVYLFGPVPGAVADSLNASDWIKKVAKCSIVFVNNLILSQIMVKVFVVFGPIYSICSYYVIGHTKIAIL